MNCRRCCHFVFSSPENQPGAYGSCRRDPPTVCVVTELLPWGTGVTVPMELVEGRLVLVAKTLYPAVFANDIACSRYKDNV